MARFLRSQCVAMWAPRPALRVLRHEFLSPHHTPTVAPSAAAQPPLLAAQSPLSPLMLALPSTTTPPVVIRPHSVHRSPRYVQAVSPNFPVPPRIAPVPTPRFHFHQRSCTLPPLLPRWSRWGDSNGRRRARRKPRGWGSFAAAASLVGVNVSDDDDSDDSNGHSDIDNSAGRRRPRRRSGRSVLFSSSSGRSSSGGSLDDTDSALPPPADDQQSLPRMALDDFSGSLVLGLGAIGVFALKNKKFQRSGLLPFFNTLGSDGRIDLHELAGLPSGKDDPLPLKRKLFENIHDMLGATDSTHSSEATSLASSPNVQPATAPSTPSQPPMARHTATQATQTPPSIAGSPEDHKARARRARRRRRRDQRNAKLKNAKRQQRRNSAGPAAHRFQQLVVGDSLVLREGDITGDQWKALSEFLQACPHIRSLRLQGVEITPRETEELGAGLKQIRNITFCDNSIGLNEGNMEVLVALLMCCGLLESTSIIRNSINDKHVPHIVTLLKKHQNLSRVSLSWNGIGDKGAKDLADALVCVRTSLRDVDLSYNMIGQPGMTALHLVNRHRLARFGQSIPRFRFNLLHNEPFTRFQRNYMEERGNAKKARYPYPPPRDFHTRDSTVWRTLPPPAFMCGIGSRWKENLPMTSTLRGHFPPVL